ECIVFGERAAAAAVAERAAAAEPPPPPEWRFTPPTEATRDAVWRLAGPVRRPEQLEELLTEPYPLARGIATNSLARRESRGGHLRVDYPGLDPELDSIHIVLSPDGTTRHEEWR
ncbi:MAG TPA: aspartate oxidase, partial [Solirubrobacterales bacterium]|nr:aspartate oxidase [Solirubrobacterales bacterium]